MTPQPKAPAKGGTETLINELLAILAIPDEASQKAALLAHMKKHGAFYADGGAAAAARDPARAVALTQAFRASGLSDAALMKALAKPAPSGKPAAMPADKRKALIAATHAALDAMGVKPGPGRHAALRKAHGHE